MEKQIFETWLNLQMDSEQAILSPLGTSLWMDGLSVVQNMQAATFFKSPSEQSSEEASALRMLSNAIDNHLIQDNFAVIAHACLTAHSPYYAYINHASRGGQIPFTFTQEEVGTFEPWQNQSVLGTSFYTNVDNAIRIPFYTYNHENSHMVLFKDYYSNLDLSDTELTELFLLIEWFCISMDLILAHDLLKNKQPAAFKELCRVPVVKNEHNVFAELCHEVLTLNAFANDFRKSFLEESTKAKVFDFISHQTIKMHINYTKDTLIEQARKIPSKISAETGRDLLIALKTVSLTDLVYKFTGIDYAA